MDSIHYLVNTDTAIQVARELRRIGLRVYRVRRGVWMCEYPYKFHDFKYWMPCGTIQIGGYKFPDGMLIRAYFIDSILPGVDKEQIRELITPDQIAGYAVARLN